ISRTQEESGISRIQEESGISRMGKDAPPGEGYLPVVPGTNISPETIVAQAKARGCASISCTYTEPTVYFELALDIAVNARENGLYNIFVTNGFMSRKALKMAAPFLDAANVDLKAFTDGFYKKWCNARLGPVMDNLVLMKSLGILVEVTTLIIPGLNDSPRDLGEMARFIVKELGEETPWHLSRFHPCYQMTDRNATPISTLQDASAMGRDAGLRYVYTGNVPGLNSENTFCHHCGKLLIQRHSYTIKNHMTPEGACPQCGTELYGIFHAPEKK
ncbi:MAG: AmmeMemoRadiSam system radical SAM enzyme, partial [Desulfamplus sp.]|nr:AmmeMemoRadiSam system radical SAM enzyme [Desulfamplus sp.]